MTTEDTITIPRALLQQAVDLLWGIEDRGPPGEGWKSDELQALIDELERLLGDAGIMEVSL